MGTRENGLNVKTGYSAIEEEPGSIEREIQRIRTDLDGLVKELDRRRHDALDWRLQVRRHSRQFWFAAAIGGLVVATLAVLYGGRRRDPVASTRELLNSLRVVAANPEDLRRAVDEQQPTSRIVSGASTLAAAALPALARRVVAAS